MVIVLCPWVLFIVFLFTKSNSRGSVQGVDGFTNLKFNINIRVQL